MADDKMQTRLCERIAELEKENARLKWEVKLLSEKVGFWEEQTKAKEEQIEEYDRLTMFDIARTDELKAQIEKMENCWNCKFFKEKKYQACIDYKKMILNAVLFINGS